MDSVCAVLCFPARMNGLSRVEERGAFFFLAATRKFIKGCDDVPASGRLLFFFVPPRRFPALRGTLPQNTPSQGRALFYYTEQVSWTEQEPEQALLPGCPSLKGLVLAKHKISPHQLVAAGLQGIWSYILQAYLE